MDKQRLNLFHTWPLYKGKFGDKPETVFKNIHRFLDEMDDKFKKIKKELLKRKAAEKVRKEQS